MSTPESFLADQMAVGARITNFVTNASRAIGEGSRDELRTRLELLERYWSQYEFSDKGLRAFKNDPSTQAYFTEDQYGQITEAYCEAKTWILKKQARFEAPSIQTTSAQQDVVAIHNSDYFEKVKLPRFNGNQRDWDEFKAKFESLIVEDKVITSTIKFQHLINSLDGKAADTLKGFQVTGDKFQGAWEHLCSTYDNRAHRFYAHMEALVNLKAATRETAEHLNLLLTTANQSISVFRNLRCPVQHWDEVLVFLLESKLALYTRRDWLKRLERRSPDEPPKFEECKQFLEARIRNMNTLGLSGNESPKVTSAKSKSSPQVKKNTSKAAVLATSSVSKPNKTKTKSTCGHCAKPHFIAYCVSFKQLTEKERRQAAAAKQLCFNCLRPNHRVDSCPSAHTCSSCNQKHHSLLHLPQPISASGEPNHAHATVGVAAAHDIMGNSPTRMNNHLATAMIVLENPNGGKMSVRALLDSCAQETIISEHVAQSLSLTRVKASTYLTGSGGTTAAVARYRATVMVRSSIEEKLCLETSVIILQKVSNPLQGYSTNFEAWDEFKGITLADPISYHDGQIDCILSSFVYGRVMRHGMIQPHNLSLPVALNTAFGWIILGPVPDGGHQGQASVFVSLSADRELSNAVEKFWTIEEVPSVSKWSPEEQECMDHFERTHVRDPSGRFVVRLPFKDTPSPRKSREIALSCFHRLEKRLSKDSELAEKYTGFMNEYRSLGHLKQLKRPDLKGYFLPHHAVLRRDSGKLRVVFNASQQDATGKSLNDSMHTGPKLHVDIVIILIRWFFFPYVFTFDIVKMFRQFLVHPKDQLWQQIFWKWSADEEASAHKLTTVTYGTAAAPFLANACLLQLSKEGRQQYPDAARVIELNRYVDDFFVGADNVPNIEKLRNDLINLLALAGLQTDKFASNYESKPQHSTDEDHIHIPVVEDEIVSLLGLRWNPNQDHFRYKFKILPIVKPITKRSILSKVASLFDPIGWLCPVIIKAKMVLQHLWITGHDWDRVVSTQLQENWIKFHSELELIDQISVPRWVGTNQGTKWTLHGFADASQRAYGVAIYVVSSHGNTNSSHLIFAKSKVSPIKVIKVPRLELCAAHLLAKSIRYVLAAVQAPPQQVYCWSDARTVLSWLRGHPSKWKTFVANRVSDVITTLPQVPWNYVRTTENPADLTSRGCSPSELINDDLWWRGPPWLMLDSKNWPIVTPDEKENHETLNSADEDPDDSEQELAKPFESKWICTTKTEWSVSAWLEQFSTLSTPVAALAICRRWLYRIRRDGLNPDRGPLTAYELRRARTRLIAMLHREVFHQEVLSLAKGRPIQKRSLLRNFSPFLDVEGILRAEGRLEFSHLPEDEKYPILLPGDHHFTLLLVREAHLTTLHGGTSLVLSVLLRHYWIIRGRNVVRKIIQGCVSCARHNAKVAQPRMAPLPAPRTTLSRPFTHTGLDYAGPFMIKRAPGRGAKCFKGYLAIFICLAVKAVHLEIVSDYTSATFIAAFRRFTSRRGLPKVLYSDNGTTFRGANAEIQRLFQQSSNLTQEGVSALAKSGIEWSFIPPHAPNFGGLWESNIKSFKSHLKRTIGQTKLTFEELYTVTCQIEACLNSRPLSVVSMDHEAPVPLTPGHFLSGSSLVAIPATNDSDALDMSYRNRWELTQIVVRHFWRRWAREYLTQLHNRTKWLHSGRPFQINDIVLIRDDLTTSSQWPMGKVIKVYSGKDGISRVARIKTSSSELTRPVSKLILLPTNDRAASFLSMALNS